MVSLETDGNKNGQPTSSLVDAAPKVEEPIIKVVETNKNVMSATVKIKQGNSEKEEEVKILEHRAELFDEQQEETPKLVESERKLHDQTQELQ